MVNSALILSPGVPLRESYYEYDERPGWKKTFFLQASSRKLLIISMMIVRDPIACIMKMV